jgi:predicted nuclease of predicted toxin-antitoxin system
VKLLFDQNLSRLLVGRFAEEFPDSRHVTEVGLDRATDREVWEFARAGGYVIVSKDSDFRQLAFLFGPPPKVVWLRVERLVARHRVVAAQLHRCRRTVRRRG